MADIIQSNYEALESVGKGFQQHEQRTRQLHARLARQVQQLRATWVGKGSDSFFTEMQERILPRSSVWPRPSAKPTK